MSSSSVHVCRKVAAWRGRPNCWKRKAGRDAADRVTSFPFRLRPSASASAFACAFDFACAPGLSEKRERVAGKRARNRVCWPASWWRSCSPPTISSVRRGSGSSSCAPLSGGCASGSRDSGGAAVAAPSSHKRPLQALSCVGNVYSARRCISMPSRPHSSLPTSTKYISKNDVLHSTCCRWM